jgi:hypothetical protein
MGKTETNLLAAIPTPHRSYRGNLNLNPQPI